MHGSGATFHGHPNGFLPRGLAARGYGVLGINTRQSGKRVNTDNFLEVRRDLEAAVYTARALGYRTRWPAGSPSGDCAEADHVMGHRGYASVWTRRSPCTR